MEREIVLSSCSVKNKGNNKPGKFITKFTRPIVLDNNHEYAIGLNRIINMSFTWFNIYIYIYIYNLHGNSLARRGGLDPARFSTPLTEPPLRFRTGN